LHTFSFNNYRLPHRKAIEIVQNAAHAKNKFTQVELGNVKGT